MSVLNGFAMLNKAIRDIRVDNQRHAYAMANVRQQQAQMEREWNDPQKKLARVQAARQLEDVPINFTFGKFDNARDKEFYNRYTKPAIERIMDDNGMELGDNGQALEKGTTEIASRPRYVAKSLANQLGLAAQASRLGHTELDFKIDKLEEDVYEMRKRRPMSSHPKEKFVSQQLKLKENKLAELQAERNDPSKTLGRLVASNMRIAKMQTAAMTDPNIGDEFYTRLDGIAKRNNDQIEILAAQGAASGKNLKEVTYSYKGSNGEISETSMFFPGMQASMAPQYMRIGNKTYERGEITNANSEGDSKLPGNVTLKTAQSINDTFNRKKDLISAAEVSKASLDRTKEILNDGTRTEQEIENLALYLRDNSEELIANWRRNIEGDIANYGRFEWFQKGAYVKKSESKETPSKVPAKKEDNIDPAGIMNILKGS